MWVVGEPVGVMDVPVEPPVAPVHVHVGHRREHRVVCGGIEVPLLLPRAVHDDRRERLGPRALRRRAHGVEVPPGRLGPEIPQRAVDPDRRDRHLHLDGSARRRIEVEVRLQLPAAHVGVVLVARPLPAEPLVDLRRLVDDAVGGEGRGELDGEVHRAVRRPAPRLAVPGDRRLVLDAQLRPEHLTVVVVDAADEIEDHVRGSATLERVAVQADARGGRELGLHGVVLEEDRVRARLGRLVVVREAGAVARVRIVLRAGVEHQRPGRRHQQHVAEVRVPRAAEVRVGEAENGRVAVLVARRPAEAALERGGVGLGTELDHPPRDRRAGIGVPLAARPDERVDVVDGRLGCAGSALPRRSHGRQPRPHPDHPDRQRQPAVLLDASDRPFRLCPRVSPALIVGWRRPPRTRAFDIRGWSPLEIARATTDTRAGRSPARR